MNSSLFGHYKHSTKRCDPIQLKTQKRFCKESLFCQKRFTNIKTSKKNCKTKEIHKYKNMQGIYLYILQNVGKVIKCNFLCRNCIIVTFLFYCVPTIKSEFIKHLPHLLLSFKKLKTSRRNITPNKSWTLQLNC